MDSIPDTGNNRSTAPPATAQPPQPPRRNHPGLLVALVGVLVVALGFGARWFLGRNDQQITTPPRPPHGRSVPGTQQDHESNPRQEAQHVPTDTEEHRRSDSRFPEIIREVRGQAGVFRKGRRSLDAGHVQTPLGLRRFLLHSRRRNPGIARHPSIRRSDLRQLLSGPPDASAANTTRRWSPR